MQPDGHSRQLAAIDADGQQRTTTKSHKQRQTATSAGSRMIAQQEEGETLDIARYRGRLIAAKRLCEDGAMLQMQVHCLASQRAELREEPEFRTDSLSRQGFHGEVYGECLGLFPKG